MTPRQSSAFFLLLAGISLPLLAQHETHIGHTAQINSGANVEPPGAIDGAKNPALIPDEAAIKIFMLVLAEPANATPSELARQRVKIARAKLNETDISIVQRRMADFDQQHKMLKAQAESLFGSLRIAPNLATRQQYDSIQSQIATVVANQWELLLKTVSPEGAQKLKAHLTHVKSTIRIIPSPRM